MLTSLTKKCLQSLTRQDVWCSPHAFAGKSDRGLHDLEERALRHSLSSRWHPSHRVPQQESLHDLRLLFQCRFFPPGRCLMNSPGSQRWDAKYISYLHHHYIFLIELKLHLSNTSDQRWFLCVQQALGETGRQPIGEGVFSSNHREFWFRDDLQFSLLWEIYSQVAVAVLAAVLFFRLFHTLFWHLQMIASTSQS